MPKATPKSTPVLQTVSEDSRVLVDASFCLEAPALDSITRQQPPPSPLWPATPPSLSKLVCRNTFVEFCATPPPFLDVSKRDRALSEFSGLQLIEAGLIEEEDWCLPPAACDIGDGYDSQCYSGESWPDAGYAQWHTSEAGYIYPEHQMMLVPVEIAIAHGLVPVDQHMHNPSFTGTYEENKLLGIFGSMSEVDRRCNAALWS